LVCLSLGNAQCALTILTLVLVVKQPLTCVLFLVQTFKPRCVKRLYYSAGRITPQCVWLDQVLRIYNAGAVENE